MELYVEKCQNVFIDFFIFCDNINISLFISKKMEKKITVQDWVEIDTIFENGIIKLKDNKFIKIIKVIPINFNLKSNFEKNSILNSYKIFLKTCNFDIQILIQSNKEDLKKNIENIKENLKKENKDFLNEVGNNYIEFINLKNNLKYSSTKDFYIIISNKLDEKNNIQDLIFEELNEKFLKIKECLLRCGNSVKDINNKKDTEKILFSFYNSRNYFNKEVKNYFFRKEKR